MACGCRPASSAGPHLAELRETQARLRGRLQSLLAHDPVLTEAATDTGEVMVAIRSGLVEALVQEVAARYLDRVVLDLSPELKVHQEGEIKTKTFLGTLKAGDWKLDLTIHNVRGVLRAKTPRVGFGGTNRVRLDVPVVLEEAEGAATVGFGWRASSVAHVVCRDFDVTRRLRAKVVPQEYPVTGAFLLSATPTAIIAQPHFPEQTFRLRIDLREESWAEIRRALESQDRLLRCGVALDPDQLLPRLRELAHSGFDFRLPRSLFRTVELPASVRQSVRVENKEVELTVRPSALRVTPHTLWYSAAVRSRVRAASR